MPTPEASVSKINGLVKFGKVSTGAFAMADLSFSKALVAVEF